MKIELHVHTSEISVFCGQMTVREVVESYAKANYDAVVITNHFNSLNIRGWQEKTGRKDFVRAFFDTIDQAAETAGKHGMLILPGHELRFDENANDYLVYGLTEELCRNWNELCAMTPASFSEFAVRHGLLFYQAHPFRNQMTVVRPEYLFGIEVQNTHPRHDSRNDIALAWAEKFGLHKICGSDCHRPEDVGTSAIITDHPVKEIGDLIHVLKNDLYTIE